MKDSISKSGLGASMFALSLAAALPTLASAQVVWPTVPTTRVRSFNNLSQIVINDRCVGLEDEPTDDPTTAECFDLQDDVYTVPVLEKASPYPANIVVPDAAFVAGSKITDVNVTLRGVAHHFLDDVDIVLVGPQGQYVMLASNLSGLDDGIDSTFTPLSWKFDDAARLPLPNANNNDGRASTRQTVTVNGVSQPNPLYNLIYPEWVGVWSDSAVRTFKPTDYDSNLDTDLFPAPAPQNLTTPAIVITHNATTGVPAISGGGKLSTFNGASPVGTWSLYVADDFFFYDGALAGWEIEITAQQP